MNCKKLLASFISAGFVLITLPSQAMSTFGAHPGITAEASKYFYWGDEATQLLIAAAIYPDREHNTTAFNKEYFPELHFDRYKTETDAKAFNNGLESYKANLATAIKLTKKNNLVGALTYLGGALHAVEDFGSHSNYIEMSKSDQSSIDKILFEGGSVKNLPKSLRITHYDPDAKIPGIPEGSDYAHNIMSKDYPFRGEVSQKVFPNGETGYQIAYDTNVYFARRVLALFMHSVDETSYRQITNIEIWNIFPLAPTNCHIGDVNETDYDAMRENNIVCDGPPEYVYKLNTVRSIGINTFDE